MADNMLANCVTQRAGGIEVKAWFVNRANLTATFDATNPSLVTELTVAVEHKLVTLTGVKRGMDSGHSLSAAENRANRYPHTFNFEAFEIDTDAREQLDAMDDVVVIYQRRDAAADGRYIIKGLSLGLEKSEDTLAENTDQSARKIALSTPDAYMGEPFSAYTLLVNSSAPETAARLVALEVIQEA